MLIKTQKYHKNNKNNLQNLKNNVTKINKQKTKFEDYYFLLKFGRLSGKSIGVVEPESEAGSTIFTRSI